MAYGVYSVSLCLTHLTDSSVGQLLFEVPPGYVYIVREMSVATGANATTDTRLGLQRATAQAVVWRPKAIPDRSAVQWQGRLVMEAGDQLLCWTGGANADVVASGYSLTA